MSGARLRRLASDCTGSAIVEFGILAPALLTLVLGALQVGLWMQTYNALRSVEADTSRYVTVEYQKSNRISNIDMAVSARNLAINTYMFDGSRLSTDVQDTATQPITGVTEKTLTISYTMSSILGIAGVAEIPITFSRPIFVKTTA